MRYCCEVFGFVVRFLVLLWGILFLPWGFRFCREVFSFAVTVVGHRITYSGLCPWLQRTRLSVECSPEIFSAVWLTSELYDYPKCLSIIQQTGSPKFSVCIDFLKVVRMVFWSGVVRAQKLDLWASLVYVENVVCWELWSFEHNLDLFFSKYLNAKSQHGTSSFILAE